MARRLPLASGIQVLTAPKTLLTFLTGGIALSVLGNAVYQLLTNWLPTSNYTIIGIIMVSVLVLVGVGWMIEHLAQRWRPAPPLPNKQPPQQRRGIIFLVSNEPTIQRALAWHRDTLQWCWLVCSEQTLPLAGKLRAELQAQGKKAELVVLNDVFDLVECRNKVDAIYTQLPAGCTPADVILDFTGMTTIASVGAVLACLDEQRAMQYTPAVFNEQLHAVQPRDPVEVVLSWGMLDGQRQTTEAAHA
jgi:hypothetical protein